MTARSLRFRIAVGTSVCCCAVLGLLCWGIYASMRTHLIATFDEALKIQTQRLADLVEHADGQVQFDINPAEMPEFASRHPRYLFVFQNRAGDMVARSAASDVRPVERARPDPGVVTSVSSSGRTWRATSVDVVPRPSEERDRDTSAQVPGGPFRLTVAGETSEVEGTLRTLAVRLCLFCAAAIVAVTAALVLVVVRSLSPLKSMAAEIGAIDERQISRRVSRRGVPAELAPVVDKLNDLLDRLARAFGRERAFTGDAAHEFRTPIAGLRSLIEVCLLRQRTPEDYEATLAECLAITERLEAVARSLLSLASADRQSGPAVLEHLELGALVSKAWGPLEPVATNRRLTVRGQRRPAGVLSDPDMLLIVTANLLENAASHSDEGGDVRWETGTRDGRAFLTISNSGCRVDSRDAPNVFERYWRGDASRQATGAHVGLGLSLVRRLVDVVGGTVEVSCVAGGRFTVTLSLPAAEGRPSALPVAEESSPAVVG